jgi:outer membrane lipoprotein SlyB
MTPTPKLATAVVALAIVLGGCASGQGGSDYTRAQARSVQEVQMGTVEGVRTVKIEGTKSPIGAGVGAVVGGVAGSTVGGGRGQIAGAAIGAVLGGLGGAAAEEAITRETGLEITVKLDSGRTIAVVQGVDGQQFAPGDRVRLLTGGGTTRVTR